MFINIPFIQCLHSVLLPQERLAVAASRKFREKQQLKIARATQV